MIKSLHFQFHLFRHVDTIACEWRVISIPHECFCGWVLKKWEFPDTQPHICLSAFSQGEMFSPVCLIVILFVSLLSQVPVETFQSRLTFDWLTFGWYIIQDVKLNTICVDKNDASVYELLKNILDSQHMQIS